MSFQDLINNAVASGQYVPGVNVPPVTPGAQQYAPVENPYYNQQAQDFYAQQEAVQQYNQQQNLAGISNEPIQYRQMNAVEGGLTGLREWGEGLAGITGWNPEAGFTPENIVRFAGSIPFQMVSGLAQAPSDLYELATGQPVLEGEGESGLMPDYDLDMGQRVASGLNAAINTVGLGFGGSSRLIGGLGKVASGGKLGSQAARGVFGELFTNPAAKRVGQTVFDVAEEGTEEFVQSYLDDTRFKQIDENSLSRAIEGAKWGALGGGISSGVGQGVSYGYDKLKGRNETDAQAQPDANDQSSNSAIRPAQDIGQDYAQVQNRGMNLEYMPGTKAEVMEEYKKSTTLKGASSFKASNTDSSLGLGEHIPGVDNLRAIYEDSQQGANIVVKAFENIGINEQQLRGALYQNERGRYTDGRNEFMKSSDALNSLQGNNKIRSYTKRDPALNINAVETYIVKWREGDGVTVNPAFFTAYNADHDGDNTTIFLDASEMQVGGSIAHNLVESEKESSTVDWNFLLGADETLASLEDDFQDVLQITPTDTFNPATAFQALKNALNESDSKKRNYLISTALTHIVTNLDSIKAADPSAPIPSGEEFVNRWTKKYTSTIPAEIQAQLDAEEEALREYVEAEAANIEDISEEDRIALNQILIPQSGATSDMNDFLSLYPVLGLLTTQRNTEGNVTYRQNPEMYFAAKDVSEVASLVNGFQHIVSRENVVKAIIRAQFKMTQQNHNPGGAIEGLFDRLVLIRALSKFGLDSRVQTKEDMDRLLDCFKEAYDATCISFNNAQNKETSEGWEKLFDAPWKEMTTDKNILRNFTRIFGHRMFVDIFPDNYVKDAWKTLTLAQVLERVIQDPHAPHFELFFDKTTGAYDFFKRLRGAYGTLRTTMETSIEGILTNHEFSDTVYDAVKKGSTENLKLQDEAQIGFWLDGINQLISVATGVKAGLTTTNILDTKIGQMLFSRIGEERLRAVIGLAWRGQFIDIVNALKNKELNPAMFERALYAMEQKGFISPIHAQIVNELSGPDNTFAGDSPTLDMLTDLNIRYGRLKQDFKNRFGDYDNIKILLDGLRSEVSEFDLSTISNRMLKARSSVNLSDKAKYEIEKNYVNEIREIALQQGQESLVDYFNYAVETRRASMDVSILAMQIYATKKPSHDAVDKGTIQEAARHFAEANNIVQNGRLISFVESLLTEPMNIVDRATFNSNPYYFLNLMADPKLTYIVQDSQTLETEEVNRDKIFAEASENYRSDIGPTALDILSLLDKQPQLTGWLCEQSPQALSGGNASTTHASRGHIVADYRSFIEDRNPKRDVDVSLRLYKKEKLREIENMLLNSPTYKKELIHACGSKLVGATAKQTNAYVREMHRTLVGNYYVAAMNHGGQDLIDIYDEENSRYAHNTIDIMLEHIEGALSAFSERSRRQFDIHGAEAISFLNRSRIAAYVMSEYGYNDIDSLIGSMYSIDPESNLQNAIDLIGLNMNFFGVIMDMYGLDLDRYFTIDHQYINDIAENIVNDKTNANKTKKQKAALKADIVNNITKNVTTASTIIENTTLPTEWFQAGDGQNLTEAVVAKKIKSIIKYAGKKQLSNQELKQEAKDFMSDITAGKDKWNAVVLMKAAQELNTINAKFNPNMIKTRNEVISNRARLVEEISEKVIGGTVANRLDSDVDAAASNFRYIDYDFTTPELEAMSSANTLMDNAGYNEMEVALNGSVMKKMMGFGELPQIIKPTNEGEAITIRDLKERYRQSKMAIGNHHVMLAAPEDVIDLKDIRLVSSIVDDNTLAPDTQVYYYDPENSAHGIDSLFVPEGPISGQKKYHRGPRLLLAIISESMEAMVLKNKKALKEKEYLAQKHKTGQFSDMIKTGNVVTMQQDLLDGFKQYRSMYANLIAQDFVDNKTDKNSRLGNFGWGFEEGLIIAQMLTPGVSLHLTDGSNVTIDAAFLFGSEEAFNAKIGEVTQNGTVGISSIRVITTSPQYASARAMYAASREYETSGSAMQAREKAANAITDWSDFKYNTIGMRNLLGGMNSIGQKFASPLVAEATPSEMQLFLENEWYGRLGATYNGPSAFYGGNRPVSQSAINLYNQLKTETIKFTGDENEAVAIVRCFGNVDENQPGSDFLNRLKRQKYDFDSTDDMRTAAIVLSAKDLPAALSWASKTNGDLLIDRNMSIPSRYRDYVYSQGVSTTRPKQYDRTDFLWVRTDKARRSRRVLAGSFKDSLTPLSQNSIALAYVDTEERNDYKIGDAEIKVNPNGETEFIVDGSSCKFFSLTSLFEGWDKDSGITILEKDGIDRLREEFNEDELAFIQKVHYTGKSTEDAKIRELKAFFSDPRVSDNGVLETEVSHGNIIAIASAIDDAGNATYAPIYLPNIAPLHTRSVRIFRDGSNAAIAWTGRIGITKGTESYVKGNLHGEAFKGIMQIAHGLEFPTLAGTDIQADLLINGSVEEGRLGGGKLEMLLPATFHYLNQKLGLSAIFVKDQKGNVALTDHIKKQLKTETEMNDFLGGRDVIWDDFASGKKTLFDPHSQGGRLANEAARKIIRVAKLRGQSYLSLFTSFDSRGNLFGYDFNYHLYYGDEIISEEELYALFSHFTGEKLAGRQLCSPTRYVGKKVPVTKMPLVNEDGNLLMKAANNRIVYNPVRVQVTDIIGDFSEAHVPSGRATWSMQQRYTKGLELGFADNEFAKAVEYGDMLLDNNIPGNLWQMRRVPEGQEGFLQENWTPAPNSLTEILNGNRAITMREFKTLEKVNQRGDELTRIRTLTEKDGADRVDIKNPESHPLIVDAMEYLNRTLESNFGYRWLQSQANRIEGFTFGKVEENNKVDVAVMASAIRQLADNIVGESKVPVDNVVKNGLTHNNRFALAMLTPEEIEYWWEGSPVLQRIWSDTGLQGFTDAVIQKGKECAAQTANIITTDRAKFIQLSLANEYDFSRHGLVTGNTRLYGTTFVEDVAHCDDVLINALSRGEQTLTIDTETFNELAKNSNVVLSDLKEIGMKGNRRAVNLNMFGENVKILGGDTSTTITIIFNNATQLSKVMAMLNPGVFTSNVIDRGIHQGIFKASMRIGHSLHVGPYVSKHWLDQTTVRNAARDPRLVRMFGAYRISKLSGEDLQFLAGLENNKQRIDEWLKDREKAMSPFQRNVERVYNIFTGGNAMLHNNIEIFLNRFVMFVEEHPEQAAIWLREVDGPDGSKRTFLEQQLEADPGLWFSELIGATSRSTPSFVLAEQAMNSAATGDVAQRNVAVMFFRHVTRNSPIAKFFVTTTMMRFPEYTMNITGRLLNWIMPVSSISYVLTEKLADWGHKQKEQGKSATDPHFELAQVHRSLREAMLVDITHLGVGATAAILVGLAGGVEPPEDEKKWGNPEEWLICGIRAREAWWLEDVLGMALPLATFTRSCQLGKPRFDLLFNGLNQVCYNNPVAQISDIVGALFEPDGMFVGNYLDTVEEYSDALGGSPSYGEWLIGQATNFGLNWAGQFFTPSIVKQVYRESQEFEKSYKRVYKTNNTGVLSEDGEYGSTEKTSYLDSMVRRATRSNPMLGLLVNIAAYGETTGYLAGQMPDTLYYDDYQREQAEYWSIEGLSDADAQAKLLEIITVMQSYNDMSELRATGFYLDTYTKAALSSVVWDTVDEFDTWLNQLYQDGKMDAYYLGNGDFTTGLQIAAEIKGRVSEQKQAWSDFYYDKVRSEALSEPMVVYKRYNTDYAQDEDGNWYATGYHRNSLLPFNIAPGRRDDPEGTAGYENDWVTVSAVTGLPMEGKRALVPIEGTRQDWPDLEYWSGDGNGKGKSTLFKTWYGSGDGSLRSNSAGGMLSLGDTVGDLDELLSRDPDQTGNKSKVSVRMGGSSGGGRGGSGGSRRSSGGGTPRVGGGTINGPNLTAPRTIDRVNFGKADVDFMRPDFETKGSRDAYRRSDI